MSISSVAPKERIPFLLIVVAGLWLAVQVQRFAMASYVGASAIMTDLGITAAAAGLLASIYFPIYGSVQIPSGILADQSSPKGIILISCAASTIAGLAFALAPGYEVALGARALVGLTSAFIWMSLIKICHLMPGGQYAQRLGIVLGIGSLGSIISLGVLPALLSLWSWRIVAGLVVVPTVAVAITLYLTEAPQAGPPRRAVEIWHGSVEALAKIPAVIRRVDFWPVFLSSMLFTGAHFSVLTWLPRYASDVLGMSPATVGLLPALVPLGQLTGNIVLSTVYSRRPKNGLAIYFSAAVVYGVVLVLLASGITAKLGWTAVIVSAVLLGAMFGSYFLSIAWFGGVVPARELGTASGVMNGLGFFPAFVLPWLMGIVMDAVDQPSAPGWHYSSGAYDLAFWVAAVAFVLALLGSWLFSLRARSNRANTPMARGAAR